MLSFLLLSILFSTLDVGAASQPYEPANSQAACNELSHRFPSETHFPNTTEYEVLNSYYASHTILKPRCIFAPTSLSSAAASLPILSSHNTQLAVRAGGHSFNANFSSSSSIIVSLQRLKTLSLSADRNSVTISPGHTWTEVYSFLDPYKLAVAGARAGVVGAGGFLFGGGISFSIYEHGWASDEVVEFVVATADGEVLKASARENADLFRALKGVASPFVLVLSVEMRTFPLDNLWFAAASQTVSREVLDAAAEFNPEDDEKSHLITNFQLAPTGNGSVDYSVITTMVHTSPSEGVPGVFGRVYGTASEGEITAEANLTITNLTAQIPPPEARGHRYATWSWTLGSPSAELLESTSSIFQSNWRKLVSQGVTSQLIVIPLGPRAGDGDNVLNLEKGKKYTVCLLTIFYDDANFDREVTENLEKTEEEIEKEAKRLGMWTGWKYANYANSLQQTKMWEGYGEENVRFLKEVRDKYDPNGKWARMVPGGWHIPSM